jgi:hypothetical protein
MDFKNNREGWRRIEQVTRMKEAKKKTYKILAGKSKKI